MGTIAAVGTTAATSALGTAAAPATAAAVVAGAVTTLVYFLGVFYQCERYSFWSAESLHIFAGRLSLLLHLVQCECGTRPSY